MATILIVEDEAVLVEVLKSALQDVGHDVHAVLSGEDALSFVKNNEPDVILLDMRLPKMDGMQVLEALKSDSVSSAVVVMTAHGSIELAVSAMKLGAEDFLTKPVDLSVLELTLNRILTNRNVSQQLQYHRHRERSESGIARILGRSESIEQIRQKIGKLAASPSLAGSTPPGVLITGETGSGKDVVSRAIHYEGPRAASPFVHLNCAAVPRDLFESELFGHAKGAFTSAGQSRKGLMELADGGTLFLDEIGHVDPAIQAKLLTAIEQKRIRPIGATAERSVNVHVIAATNRDLEQAVAEGEFRADLYHRLRVFHLHLSPLRERLEDVELLAEHFLAEYAGKVNLAITKISPEAKAILSQYDWPGNVRELSHVIETAVLMCDGDTILPEHLQIQAAQSAPAALEVKGQGFDPVVVDFNQPGSILADVEKALIEAALKHARHNISRAARILGITREAVRYRLRKHRERQGDAEESRED